MKLNEQNRPILSLAKLNRAQPRSIENYTNHTYKSKPETATNLYKFLFDLTTYLPFKVQISNLIEIDLGLWDERLIECLNMYNKYYKLWPPCFVVYIKLTIHVPQKYRYSSHKLYSCSCVLFRFQVIHQS